MNNTKNSRTLFLICCYGYAVNGMAVLVIGSILPSLIAEAGISFAAAGGMLSLMAVGNFLASLLFPAMVSVLDRRVSITAASALVPLSFLGLTTLPPVPVLYLLMLFGGIARGSITILNNSVVNDSSDNPARMLNYLHCSFAVGAFTAPFVTAVLLNAGFGWRAIILLLAALCLSSCLLYALADYSAMPERRSASNQAKGSAAVFFKNFDFYCISFLLFFYLGFENCVNGWFVTYLQNTGIMTPAFASSLVSVTWIVIMVGRLVCIELLKWMRQRTLILFSCAGSALFFFLLSTSHSLPLVTVSLAGLGFCLSGIYPTCVAAAGAYIKGSTLGMSVLTAISAFGGIVTPQLIGMIADRLGIVQAVGTLAVNVVLMILLALLSIRSAARHL